MSVSSKPAGAKLLWLTVLAGAGVVASATAATVYAASDLQRVRARHDSAGLKLEASRDLAPLRALTDSLVAPLGALRPTDSATLTQVVALIAKPADSSLWIAHPPADSSPARAMAVYRRWARSTPLPAFWGMRADVLLRNEAHAIPTPDLRHVQQLAAANEAAADSALLAGDTDAALARARENIAGARHLVWQPRPADASTGRSMLTSGAKLLARTALQAQQPTLHASARRLVTLSNRVEPFPRAFVARPHVQPDDHALLAMAADTTLHAATRFLAIELMVAGACRSTREVLFGPTAERHNAIDAMIDATSDIPRLAELRPVYHQALDRLDGGPRPVVDSVNASESVTATLLRLVVPGSVQARIDACRDAGA